MVLGDGHQVIQPIGFGTTMKDDSGNIVLGDIVRFDARCVNPKPGMTSIEWISAGFPDAECD
jgi:branched-chain amino acid transport system substrate-binding protein